MATRNVDNALLVQENADIKDEQPNVDLKRQFAGDEKCLKIVKEQEGSREQVDGKSDKHSHTPITQDEQDTELRILEAVTLHENDTASNIDKENTGNNVDDCAYSQEQTIINAESENSGKAVENVNEIGNEHVEKCIESESDEELAEIKDQSSTGKSGIPCVLEQTGGSEYGSDCLENEIVSHIKILNENDAVKDSTCEEMTEEKIDAEVRKFEEKVSEVKIINADSKSEMGRFNACCQNGEIDKVEGEKSAVGKDDPAEVNSKLCEKAERFVNSFVQRVKVAYKLYRGCTENFFFQTVFVLTIVFQRNNPEFFHFGNPILNQFHADLNQTPHNGFQENSVFPVLGNSSAPQAISIYLPEPNLPMRTDIVRSVNIDTLGITFRPDFENTANSGSMDRSQPRVDSSQYLQHTGTGSGGHQSNDEVQRSSEFISISSLPMTATVREGENDSRQVQRCTQINDVPALPVPNQLSLDEGSTNRKETQPVRNIFTNVIQSRQSADGSPSSASTNLIDRNIPTVGTYSLERIPEYASHLSNSVSEQPSQQISDDMVFGEEQMTNILARARTFDDRWPHRHLNPGDMARAGFFFTGKFQKHK
ncbi:uncharacterized protein LOC132731153 [Ruditapes philippinarum]|uniref:uncharacterized protein LOC132731153 n=1 Tax=Ruditapes philippinarum TaxID=129788 RepID=UPI00295B0410|nr:uncharacterized protein LOC132731153 [Ruditapes philippinarum]